MPGTSLLGTRSTCHENGRIIQYFMYFNRVPNTHFQKDTIQSFQSYLPDSKLQSVQYLNDEIIGRFSSG